MISKLGVTLLLCYLLLFSMFKLRLLLSQVLIYSLIVWHHMMLLMQLNTGCMVLKGFEFLIT